MQQIFRQNGGGGEKTVLRKKYKKHSKKEEPEETGEEADRSTERRGRQLTPEVLNQIKDLLKEGKSVKEIEEIVGVSNPTIYKIKNSLNL